MPAVRMRVRIRRRGFLVFVYVLFVSLW